MKSWLALFAFLLACMSWSQRADAQIEDGDVRLYFDLSVLSYTARTIGATSNGTSVSTVNGSLGVGTGVHTMSAAGMGTEYAVSPNFCRASTSAISSRGTHTGKR